MKLSFLLFTLLILASCKNTNATSGKASIPFDSRLFSSYQFEGDISLLRKKLLHEVYLTKKGQTESSLEEINANDFEKLKDDQSYNQNFSKLIVSFYNRDELYYIPAGTKQADIISALNLKLEKNKSFIWKSEIKKGATAFLIEASPTEVLENEINFQTEFTSELTKIGPFQIIEVTAEILKSRPLFIIQSNTVKIRGCKNTEAPELCQCDYTRIVPNGNYSEYEKFDNDTFGIFKNDNGFYKTILKGDENNIEAKELTLSLPSSEAITFISNPSQCGGQVHAEQFILKNYFQYKVNFKIKGASETIVNFGILPKKI